MTIDAEYNKSYLNTYLKESLLLELSNNSTLYHRSPNEYKVGDKIMGQRSRPDVKEMLLEYVRQKSFEDLPNRTRCIYSSPVPRSRFMDKGILYVVKPIGNHFITDSRIIDEIGNKISDYGVENRIVEKEEVAENIDFYLGAFNVSHLIDRYWKGSESNKSKDKLQDLEILSEGIEIIEVINQTEKLFTGDEIKVVGEFSIELPYFLTENETDDEETAKTKQQMIAKYFDSVDKSKSYNQRGTIKKGTVLKVAGTRRKMDQSKDERKEFSAGPSEFTAIYLQFPDFGTPFFMIPQNNFLDVIEKT